MPSPNPHSYETILPDIRRQSRRWLVTGAAGFIGSHLVQRLCSLGQSVVGIDNFATGLRSNIEILQNASSPGTFTFFETDITRIDPKSSLFSDIDYVLHQAALGSVPRSLENPLASHSSNVDGFLCVMEASRYSGVKRIVYASSSSVYGDTQVSPKREDVTGNLLSPYAATKAIDEIYATVYERCYGASAIGLRYFNVFGPRQNPSGPYAAVIPLWIDSILKGKAVYINGDGTQSRDFCYVENVIRANILAALTQDPNASGRAFNIACGASTSLNELFHHISSAVRKFKPEIEIMPPLNRAARFGDIKHSLANITLAHSLLGYEPEYDVQKGLFATVEYFIKNGVYSYG